MLQVMLRLDGLVAAVWGEAVRVVAGLMTGGLALVPAVLVRAETSLGRNELADATGLSSATILAGVKKMDLIRIRGVGVKHGALLLAASVDTVPELAQRNPQNLHATLITVNVDKQIVVDSLNEAEVADWVARAKAAPRIIMY